VASRAAARAVARSMVARATKPKPVEDIVEVFDFAQRSEEWFEHRRGIPTASVFDAVMASGLNGEASKSRATLLRRLAGERITGVAAETYVSREMQRGIDMEPAARDYYARTRFVELEQVGFVRRTIANPFGPPLIVGCSPDAFWPGRKKLLQIKTMKPELLIALAEKGTLPSGYRPQCQGELWVAGAEEIDLMFFYEGMPIAPTFTMQRDEPYIGTIKDACAVFDYDLRKLVEKIQSMGPKR
jgi:hypothetical protein